MIFTFTWPPSTSLSATENETGCATFQFVVENVNESVLTVTRPVSWLANLTVVAAVGSDFSDT